MDLQCRTQNTASSTIGNKSNLKIDHNVNPLPPRLSEAPSKFSGRKGGLAGSQFLEVGCWERGGDFFLGQF